MADTTNTPWAEVVDAGIGEAAAKLKNKLLLLYDEDLADPSIYKLTYIFNRDSFKGETILKSDVIFLVWTNKNHYDTLRLKPGKTWPTAVKSGGSEEEILDLGMALEGGESGKRKYRKGTRRHKKPSRHFSRRHGARGTHE